MRRRHQSTNADGVIKFVDRIGWHSLRKATGMTVHGAPRKATGRNGRLSPDDLMRRSAVDPLALDQFPNDAFAGAVAAEVKQRIGLFAIQAFDRVAEPANWSLVPAGAAAGRRSLVANPLPRRRRGWLPDWRPTTEALDEPSIDAQDALFGIPLRRLRLGV